jgi:peptide/nickel transport system substrate-binding protein
MADGQDVTTLNPLLATSANITTLSELTMAHFVRFDARDRPVPELLTEIPSQRNRGISADGRAITFHLRHGVRWSDGAPFDADDVAYTFAAIANSANNITSRDAFDRIASVEEPDKFTIVVRLKAPYAPFYYKFFSTWGLTCVLPKHVLGASTLFNDVPYNALPVGIGPFRYTAFRRGDAVEMEANPFYFRGRPKLRKIVYKTISDENTLFAQLQTGELDLWASVSGAFAERVRHLPNVRAATVPTPFVSGIYLNTARPNVGDARVRRALRLLTDRPYLVENVYHNAGTIAESVVPAVDADYDRTLPFSHYDPAAAARLLDAAGIPARRRRHARESGRPAFDRTRVAGRLSALRDHRGTAARDVATQRHRGPDAKL